ncbi:MAG: bifunctional oligoribonuclease/PAP phosphatase NrnA [Thermodesulfovibrionales bacterium]|nr:bifunctional oligoribonuclease/PAP phosphatase NrnA [Thermodesulfovibrionales bacterium]
MLPPKDLLNFLKNEDNFIIATHISPDGDGLGSAIALSIALQKLCKKTILLCKNHMPKQYKFLPGSEKFITFETLRSLASNFQPCNLILIDCNDIDRITDDRSEIQGVNINSSLLIDHHETQKDYGDIKWIEPGAAATGVMVYYLTNELGVEIDKDMAINLYAAIAVDTGNFRYENTTHDVLRVASELIAAGAIPHVIYRELFESWPDGRFNLFIKVLNTLQVEDGIAVVKVTREMFNETSTTPDDTEHFVEFPRIMEDVKVSVLFREIDDNHFKVSLRSKDGINVAKIAEVFGGGGHKNAAGCRIEADFETSKSRLLGLLR